MCLGIIIPAPSELDSKVVGSFTWGRLLDAMPIYKRFMDACRFVNIVIIIIITTTISLFLLLFIIIATIIIIIIIIRFVNIDEINKLIDEARNTRQDLDVRDNLGRCALHYICDGPYSPARLESLGIIVDEFPSHLTVQDYSENSPLHLAAHHGNIEAMQMLLSKISDTSDNEAVDVVNLVNSIGKTSYKYTYTYIHTFIHKIIYT